AIVMHRMWKQLGLTMNTFLAWFITFNFINITWIFFRAKDWDHASNILQGMGGVNGVMLPEKYAHSFHEGIIHFGSVYEHIGGRSQTTVYIILGFLMVLVLKNSIFFVETFKPTRLHLVFSIVLFLTAVSMMSRVSEFLYFNF
ncbi:MAG: MBOAT family protein, partial [Sulfuricurvum sp.]